MNSLEQKLIVVLLVLALHAVALFGQWRAWLISPPPEAARMFVKFIAAPAPMALPEAPRPRVKPPVKPQAQPQPQPKLQPPHQQALASPMPPVQVPVAQAPDSALTNSAGPASPDKVSANPAPTAPVSAGAGAQLPAGPVALSSELSLACPQRTAPSYPALSRRLNEQGVVVLRVLLDEDGAVAEARVQSSSGFTRLDNAALAAVRSWQCTAPSRNGQSVRANALQPFHFELQEK